MASFFRHPSLILENLNKSKTPTKPNDPNSPPTTQKPKESIPLPTYIAEKKYPCDSYICFKPFMIDVTAVFVRKAPPNEKGDKAPICMTNTTPQNRLLVYKGDEVFVVGQDADSGWLRILPRVRTTNWNSLDCNQTWVNGQFLFPLY